MFYAEKLEAFWTQLMSLQGHGQIYELNSYRLNSSIFFLFIFISQRVRCKRKLIQTIETVYMCAGYTRANEAKFNC